MSRPLDERLTALATAARLAEGRLDDAAVTAARSVVARAGRRLGLGVETTVVALAGPTGAGKSSLFNALAGAEMVQVGRRRPTTAAATAGVWGDAPGELLDWLDVPLRHRVDAGERDPFVLLDLPDFDSVERSHREEVDRLVAIVDLLVWVVDPQKYADGSLHERYLRPLARHAGQMLVVLNQADLLGGPDRERARSDLAALVAREGLDGVPVLAASATTGEGLDAVRTAIADRVRRREAAAARLAADVAAAADALGAGCGTGRAGRLGREDRARLVAALGQAAGVPAVVDAVAGAHRRRGALATGWPFGRWVRRLRPDPLGRLRLGAGAPDEDVRTSLPGPTPVQRSGVASAARSVAQAAAGDLPAPWPSLARRAATRHEDELPGRLDRAVAGAELPARRPRWWAVAGALQRLLALVAVAGLVWLIALAALGWLQLGDVVPTPEVEGLPAPTLMLGGGVLLGLALALVAGRVNRFSARRRARRARRALDRRVAAVADEAILAPLQAELGARDELCAAVAAARG